jgi:hypothetical protein
MAGLSPSRTRGVIIIETASPVRRCLYGALLLCFLPTLVAGCHYREDSGIPAPEGKIVFDRIAVAPFQLVAPEESRIGPVHCPLCGRIVSASQSPGNPEQLLETLFLGQLEKRMPKFSFIAGERVAGVYQRVSAASLTMPLAEVLRGVGRDLDAEGVVIGFMYRFRERRGVSYTVEQPASVAFELHLLRVSDGALVWRGVFDRTQSSLMEDLLQFPAFFRESGKWVTAEELTGEGIEQVLTTFPGLP